jgi:uncharacterized protein YacL
MNARLAARLLGAAVLGAIGWAIGRTVPEVARYAMGPASVGVVLGFALTPLVLSRPLTRFEGYLRTAPVEDLFVALFGLGAGLVIAALLTVPLVLLGSPVGNLLPTVVAVVVVLVCVRVALMRRHDLRARFASRLNVPGVDQDAKNGYRPQVLVDTSAIIDGRIADISSTGFIMGEMVIPRFVLDELRHIADSPDVLRRNRGRRGLDMLNRMSKESEAPINIVDVDTRDVRDVHEVDGKLVQIARQLQAPIITNDYNLNKVAQLQGVRVLNVNELAHAVKPVVLPGEEMAVKIIQVGKEPGQGVGYLDDGTMIVVEDGARSIDQEVDVVVTRVLQTVAGRMIFAALKGQNVRSSYNFGRGR